MYANNLASSDLIYAGQTLCIPPGASVSSVTTAPAPQPTETRPPTLVPAATPSPPPPSPITPTPVVLQKTFFSLPEEGVPNNNGSIGPFCCTGRTATVYTTGNSPIGYVYFYDFPGGGLMLSKERSVAANLSILISGITDLTNINSPSQQSSIDFAAGEMQVGVSRSARAGALNYIATITRVDIVPINNQPYYDMQTIEVRMDVSLAR
jgi:hypothetical protein